MPSASKTAAGSASDRQVAVHPVILSTYPILHLYAENYDLYELSVMLRPALFVLGLTALLWWRLSKRLGDSRRAALAVSPLIMTFFSHNALLHQTEAFGIPVSWTGFLFFETAVVAGVWAAFAGVLWLLLRPRFTSQFTYILNVVATVLLALPLFHLYGESRKSQAAEQLVLERTAKANPTALPAILRDVEIPAARPDIYFILLDAYARGDVLAEVYDYDNGPFLGRLEALGFHVWRDSNSNFTNTPVSIGSTLNFAYMNELVGGEIDWLRDWSITRNLLVHSRARQVLEGRGYTTVATPSLYFNADWRDADVYREKWWYLNEYEMAVAGLTPVPWVAQKFGFSPLHELHRLRIEATLDDLPDIAELAGPKFVYAHILSPHPPYIFNAEGGRVRQEGPYHWGAERSAQDFAQYRDQVRFLNQRVEAAVRGILDHSRQPPVIVLQSDHGPGFRYWEEPDGPKLSERFGILNAIYLPGPELAPLPARLSPVNTFPLIFERCFGLVLPPLPARSYYVPENSPYRYVPVMIGPAEEASPEIRPTHSSAATP